MNFLTRKQRYEMLCMIKREIGTPNAPKYIPLTPEEEAFIVEFATEKFNELMEDPEVVAVMKRLKDR